MSPVRVHTEGAEGVACARMRRARRGLVTAGMLTVSASLALVACGDSGGGATAASQTSSQSSTQSSNQGGGQSSSQSNGQSSSQNNSQSSTQSGAGSISQSSFSTSRGTVRTFAGTSDTTLTVDVDGASRLLWSNDRGRRFRLTGPGLAAIDSPGGSGEVPLSSGQHRLAVHGDIWTIVVRPR